MFDWLKRKREDDYEATITNKSNNDIMAKLQEQQNIYSKLDFNPEHMNKYLSKCITSYLSAIYKQNPQECKKYVTDDYYKTVLNEIEKSAKLFRHTDEIINITSAELQDQIIESVNYVSEITIKVSISAIYHRENIFTGTIKKIEESYTESIVFKFMDNGWRISNIVNQNYINMNESIIKL